MQVDMHRIHGDIVAATTAHSDFCTITFKQGSDAVTLYLDKKMASVCAEIASAFNVQWPGILDPDKFALGSTIDLDAAMKVEGGK